MADDMYIKVFDELLEAVGPQRSKVLLTRMQFKIALGEVEQKMGELKSQLGLTSEPEMQIWRQISQSQLEDKARQMQSGLKNICYADFQDIHQDESEEE